MKRLALILLAVTAFACNQTPFVANSDNELMVGEWIITEVDDSDALVSKEEFLMSIMHEKYKESYVFSFEKGPKFKLSDDQGVEVSKGQYAIGAEDKTLILQIGDQELEYEMVNNNGEVQLNIQTPGELVNLKIRKK